MTQFNWPIPQAEQFKAGDKLTCIIAVGRLEKNKTYTAVADTEPGCFHNPVAYIRVDLGDGSEHYGHAYRFKLQGAL